MRYQETTAKGKRRRRRSVCKMPTFRSYVLGVVVVEGLGGVEATTSSRGMGNRNGKRV